MISMNIFYRDVVEELSLNNIDNINNFLWLKQMRIYYDNNDYTMTATQINITIKYGYEYIGPYFKLIHTPLTDRCWISIF